jgi:hypothetical protein
MLNKETQKEILDDKENKKFLVTNWTTGKDYCKAKKISDERSTPEYKAKVAAAKKAEEERLAKEAAAAAAEKERLAKIAAAKKAEEERLAKIAAAKKAEEERLAKIAAAKKAEEERLAKEKAAGWDIGDGLSSKEIYLGKSIDVYECEKLVKQKQPTANGVTFGGRNKLCYAEFNMTKRNTNKVWKSKFIEPLKKQESFTNISNKSYNSIFNNVSLV